MLEGEPFRRRPAGLGGRFVQPRQAAATDVGRCLRRRARVPWERTNCLRQHLFLRPDLLGGRWQVLQQRLGQVALAAWAVASTRTPRSTRACEPACGCEAVQHWRWAVAGSIRRFCQTVLIGSGWLKFGE